MSEQPNERLIALGDALEEFYTEKFARAVRTGQLFGIDVDVPTIPIQEITE